MRVTIGVLLTFVVILLLTGSLAYFMRDTVQTNVSTPPATSSLRPVASPTPAGTPESLPLIGEIFGPDQTGLSPSSYASWEATASKIALRFSLAAFLAGLLAFRRR